MQTLFEDSARQAILDRLHRLESGSTRQWGKMDPAQMLTHCAIALETGTGDRPMKQKLIGKVLAPLVKRKMLGDGVMPRNSPTDPTFVVADKRDFAVERERLAALVAKFA